jgi:hypothetical protein
MDVCSRVIGSALILNGKVPMTGKRFVMAPEKKIQALNGLRRMWHCGPLRQFSETQVSCHYIRYSGRILTGYAGSYVCDRCRRACGGVYLTYLSETRPEWLCGGCKNQMQRYGGSK